MARLDKSIDQIALTYDVQRREAEGGRHLRRLVPAAGGAAQGQLREPFAGADAVTAFVALENVSHAYGGDTDRTGRREAFDRDPGGRIRRGRRPFRLRQVHLDEARDRPAVPLQGNRAGRGQRRRQAAQDRRHGVPGPDPAAVAHHAGKSAAAARNRTTASQQDSPPTPRVCRARQESAHLGRLARPGRQISLGAVRRDAAAHVALPRADPRAPVADARRAVRARSTHSRARSCGA